METNVKRELVHELKTICNDKDFVCGAISNAGCEHAWRGMLDFIRTAKRNGDRLTADSILLLSLDLREEAKRQPLSHPRKPIKAAIL